MIEANIPISAILFVLFQSIKRLKIPAHNLKIDKMILMDVEEMKIIALKHALKNAAEYGKASPSGVVGKVIAEFPDSKKDMKNTMKAISDVIDEVNSMPIEEVARRMNDFQYDEKVEKTNLEKIKDKVPNAVKGKVVTRLPPEPNAAALHIGHAKAMWLDRTIADLFNGKCILRWDDTNPEKERAEYIDELKADLEWLGINWDQEVFASDYMPIFYELCEKLLNQGNAYVCTCQEEQIRERREKKKACSCRSRESSENSKLWKGMLNGKIETGKAVVRMKGIMESDNSAMRDPSLFRIMDTNKTPHFRHYAKYRVWPLYDFESAVMDSPDTIGITHPLRSKEYELRDEIYYKLIEMLGIRKPNMLTISRLSIPGYPVSKRLIKPLVENGTVWGWDDPRLVTIKGLARRGIKPEAIKEFVLQFGISTSESNPDLEKLFAENRKIIDPVSQRRMFVPKPVLMNICGLEKHSAELRNHPENDLGNRIVSIGNEVYVPSSDLDSMKEGEIFRLKDFCNVRYSGGIYEFAGNDHLKEAKKIQWVSENGIRCKVYVPCQLFDENDNINKESFTIDEGFCEPSCADLEEGDVVQFERYGFVRIDRVSDEEIICIFCHK